jgi:uridine kinase
MTDVVTIASALTAARATHPVRVGIDGFCASGKTTLADALATKLRAAGRRPIRISADDFQNPPEIRWQLGSHSPEGFRRFQIDFTALTSMLLGPLGPRGNRKFRSTWFDVRLSRPNVSAEHTADIMDVLLLDGLFLHSAPLRGYFDFTVFISADFETCLSRALERNQEGATSRSELSELYRTKYIPGFARYMNEERPEEHASFVVQT